MSAAAQADATHLLANRVAKTVVLQDGSAYVIAAIPASARLDFHKLRTVLGASRRLRLASEDEIAHDFPTLEVGAIPPFGPMVPAAEVIDSSLLEQERILCPAGDHRHSVLVDPSDIVRVTAARTASICQDWASGREGWIAGGEALTGSDPNRRARPPGRRRGACRPSPMEPVSNRRDALRAQVCADDQR